MTFGSFKRSRPGAFWLSSSLFSVVAYSSARDILFPERHQESELAAKWGHMKWGMAVWKVRHPEISVGPSKLRHARARGWSGWMLGMQLVGGLGGPGVPGDLGDLGPQNRKVVPSTPFFDAGNSARTPGRQDAE